MKGTKERNLKEEKNRWKPKSEHECNLKESLCNSCELGIWKQALMKQGPSQKPHQIDLGAKLPWYTALIPNVKEETLIGSYFEKKKN